MIFLLRTKFSLHLNKLYTPGYFPASYKKHALLLCQGTPVMSNTTWLPERPTAQMAHSGPTFYRPPKKGPSDQRAKYGVYDQNGAAGGNGVFSRYIATGPSGENTLKLKED